jgi:hypothetical protein
LKFVFFEQAGLIQCAIQHPRVKVQGRPECLINCFG